MDDVVEVRRGSDVESCHRVHGLWIGGDDREAAAGEPGTAAFWRSSMKPFQALPLVEDGAAEAFGLTSADLALCCASHAGTPRHVEGVRDILGRADLGEADLACGPHRPFDEASADELRARGEAFTRLHNNCSGKHAGMLLLAVHHGWPTEGYGEFEHPVQARIRRSLDAGWIDRSADELAWGVDGCGVPTPRLSVRGMATAFARLGRAARNGRPAPTAVAEAMREHPTLLSGPGRLVTRVLEATEGRWLVKEGAEGVLCMAAPASGWGLAVKVEDGAGRATGPASLELLDRVGALGREGSGRLDELRAPEVRNTRDDVVGRIVPRLRLRGAVASAER